MKRSQRPAISVRFMLTSVGSLIAGEALVIAWFIRPPTLGWVGFAIVAVVQLCLAAVVPPAFERTRVSARLPANATDQRDRLLVVADPLCSETRLLNEVVAREEGAAAVHVVVPLHVSPLHFLTNDEIVERETAEETMSVVVGLLRRRGIRATGSVGSDKPLESMTDALGEFPATRVLIATPPEPDSYWLERGLTDKARTLTELPIEHVAVAAPTVHGARLG